MKKPLIVFLSLLFAAVSALAQGQVNFAARVAGVYDAPVFINCTGFKAFGLPLLGPGPLYMVQLYAGATPNNLLPVGQPLPFLSGADAGYWNAEAVTINRVDATGSAYVQVRGWNTQPGSDFPFAQTWEAALNGNYPWGVSALITVKPTISPDLPAPLVGLTSFNIGAPPEGCVPEPSIVLLAVLGSIPFLLRPRNKFFLRPL